MSDCKLKLPWWIWRLDVHYFSGKCIVTVGNNTPPPPPLKVVLPVCSKSVTPKAKSILGRLPSNIDRVLGGLSTKLCHSWMVCSVLNGGGNWTPKTRPNVGSWQPRLHKVSFFKLEQCEYRALSLGGLCHVKTNGKVGCTSKTDQCTAFVITVLLLVLINNDS